MKIMEKLKRFNSIINSFPLEYEQLLPLEKKLSLENNPPNFQVKFFSDQTNLKILIVIRMN
jgi:hypothetical protein